MFKKIIFPAVYVFFICLAMSSCAINRTIPAKQLDASIVPKDFNPNKHVLLVVQLQKRYKPSEKDEKRTQQMTELLKQYYPYKFEILSPEEIKSDNEKYADTSIYKYAVVNGFNFRTHTSYNTRILASGGQQTVSSDATVTYVSYSFLDRFMEKQYAKSYPSPYLKSAVEAFANTVKKAKKV